MNAKTTAQLQTIWTTKVAGAMVKADKRSFQTSITKGTAAKAGYANLHGNTVSSLLGKGLVTLVTTLDEVKGFRIQVLVLTTKGREAIGV